MWQILGDNAGKSRVKRSSDVKFGCDLSRAFAPSKYSAKVERCRICEFL